MSHGIAQLVGPPREERIRGQAVDGRIQPARNRASYIAPPRAGCSHNVVVLAADVGASPPFEGTAHLAPAGARDAGPFGDAVCAVGVHGMLDHPGTGPFEATQMRHLEPRTALARLAETGAS